MVKEFQEVISEIKESSEYASFSKEHDTYYLAHGFLQLDAKYNQIKEWQVGFYSTKEDNLAVFETQPVKQLPFEEAFKDGGTISELKDSNKFISTKDAIDKVKEILKEKHSHEIPNSFLMIVQTINEIPTYNITAITMAFSMINTHINALTGEIVKENKSSVLDLKKQE